MPLPKVQGMIAVKPDSYPDAQSLLRDILTMMYRMSNCSPKTRLTFADRATNPDFPRMATHAGRRRWLMENYLDLRFMGAQFYPEGRGNKADATAFPPAVLMFEPRRINDGKADYDEVVFAATVGQEELGVTQDDWVLFELALREMKKQGRIVAAVVIDADNIMSFEYEEKNETDFNINHSVVFDGGKYRKKDRRSAKRISYI